MIARRSPLVSLLLAGSLLALPVRAEPDAAQLLSELRVRGSLQLLDSSARLKVSTTTRSGKQSVQVLESTARKVAGQVRTLVRFASPASVEGVAILVTEGPRGGADEVLVYLPKLRRVRKVASAQRSQSVMGTDLSFADLGGAGLSGEGAQRLSDQTEQGRAAFVVVGRAGADTPYGKVTAWVDQETLLPLKVEYQDRDGKLVKRYRSLELSRAADRPVTQKALVENLQEGSSTLLELEEVKPSTLGDEAFTQRALERG